MAALGFQLGAQAQRAHGGGRPADDDRPRAATIDARTVRAAARRNGRDAEACTGEWRWGSGMQNRGNREREIDRWIDREKEMDGGSPTSSK